jgi:hypothetical protein
MEHYITRVIDDLQMWHSIINPVSIFFYNIQEVIHWCFTHIQSVTLWKITSQGDFQHKHLDRWVRILLRWVVLDTTLYDKDCQWLAAGQCFSTGIPVSSTNKIDRHDITEILLKVALNTIKPNKAKPTL